ncbi:hypothetical protein GNM54_14050 [Salmonella enterica]|nr:hypothetical protein [Salmonella enterica]EDV3838744.1 hypothetical protein [Salmonella enterica subsp. diarizonae]EEL3820078.1 hypothetical protein [Salmonella enterica]EIB6553091.1 hypothetical protein [Salmonella enterica]HAU2694493.1 hypothetical protein [Salmonella enterica subsp. diarizonae]
MKFVPVDEAIDVILSKMSDDEKKEYLKALFDVDYRKLNEIHYRYGYSFPTPVSGWMGDEEAQNIANTLSESDIKNSVDLIPDSLLNLSRLGKSSLNNANEVLKELHSLDINYKENIAANQFLSESLGDDALTVFKAYTLADVAGCNNLKKDLFRLYLKLTYNSYNDKALSLINERRIISKNRSKAKKGKTNRHHDSALRIAMDTWDKYPNASLAGMTEEIHSHLRSKWNDTPTAETIKLWLKKSNLYPDVTPKNRDFKLVINEEG